MIEAAQRASKPKVEGGALEDGAEGHLRAGGGEEREGAARGVGRVHGWLERGAQTS